MKDPNPVNAIYDKAVEPASETDRVWFERHPERAPQTSLLGSIRVHGALRFATAGNDLADTRNSGCGEVDG